MFIHGHWLSDGVVRTQVHCHGRASGKRQQGDHISQGHAAEREQRLDTEFLGGTRYRAAQLGVLRPGRQGTGGGWRQPCHSNAVNSACLQLGKSQQKGGEPNMVQLCSSPHASQPASQPAQPPHCRLRAWLCRTCRSMDESCRASACAAMEAAMRLCRCQASRVGSTNPSDTCTGEGHWSRSLDPASCNSWFYQ